MYINIFSFNFKYNCHVWPGSYIEYISLPLVKPLQAKATPLIRSNFRCTDSKILRGSPPLREATPLISHSFIAEGVAL